ncbi:YjcZ family sporulation protein [Metabacillus litoralis]|uniref:YjcZ family sporulation protein n=1 Tax=Metabacillus litoralis TaxID=152268 RepID=A0A5C6W3Y0_9BACI|nr:YjcZ family sporulation protein [Metabacillus litoralis]
MHNYYGCGHENYGYGYVAPTTGYGNSFALIVVLFILLIIVGAAYIGC